MENFNETQNTNYSNNNGGQVPQQNNQVPQQNNQVPPQNNYMGGQVQNQNNGYNGYNSYASNAQMPPQNNYNQYNNNAQPYQQNPYNNGYNNGQYQNGGNYNQHYQNNGWNYNQQYQNGGNYNGQYQNNGYNNGQNQNYGYGSYNQAPFNNRNGRKPKVQPTETNLFGLIGFIASVVLLPLFFVIVTKCEVDHLNWFINFVILLVVISSFVSSIRGSKLISKYKTKELTVIGMGLNILNLFIYTIMYLNFFCIKIKRE